MSHLFAPILLCNTKRVDHPYALVQPEKQARTKKALEGIKTRDGCRCVLMNLRLLPWEPAHGLLSISRPPSAIFTCTHDCLSMALDLKWGHKVRKLVISKVVSKCYPNWTNHMGGFCVWRELAAPLLTSLTCRRCAGILAGHIDHSFLSVLTNGSRLCLGLWKLPLK